MQAIHKLPFEVLRNIFILSEKLQPGPRVAGLPYVGVQDSLAQVCRRWRNIAISVPELWTYIRISHPPPHLHAELSISRSGTLPIHLDLDMRAPFMGTTDPPDPVARIFETVILVEEYGGKIDRWRSLIVLSNMLQVPLTIIQLTAMKSMPALRLLSLAWEADGPLDAPDSPTESPIVQSSQLSELPSLLHGTEEPQLRHLEIIGLTSYVIFGIHSARISNLTAFAFTYSPTWALPSHRQFIQLLSASPQLEALSVDMQSTRSEDYTFLPAAFDVTSSQVCLPLLRSFSLSTGYLHQWCLTLLTIVDALEVEHFNFNTITESIFSPEKLYKYLAKGRVNGVLQSNPSIDDDVPGAEPIFPLLKDLNVERMDCSPDEILPVFRIFPTVTHITFGAPGALGLSSYPDLLPNASYFTYIDDGSLTLSLAGFPGSWATPRTTSTLTVCTDRPRKLCEELGLSYEEEYPGSERYYHLPELVDHLVVRRVDLKLAVGEGGDSSVESNQDSNQDSNEEPVEDDLGVELGVDETTSTEGSPPAEPVFTEDD